MMDIPFDMTQASTPVPELRAYAGWKPSANECLQFAGGGPTAFSSQLPKQYSIHRHLMPGETTPLSRQEATIPTARDDRVPAASMTKEDALLGDIAWQRQRLLVDEAEGVRTPEHLMRLRMLNNRLLKQQPTVTVKQVSMLEQVAASIEASSEQLAVIKARMAARAAR